jgi:hypothetical protein
MSSKEDYDAKLEVIKAIPDDRIKTPNAIPMDVYIQEAENLYQWCQVDKDVLTTCGLSWELVDDMPIRCGALREAESLWNKERFSREAAEKMWAQESPLAYDLRNELVHHFRYAFRNDSSLTVRVNAIAEGSSHADMIQDLNDLSVLGKENQELLANISFDITLLDQAAQKADEMAALLAEATRDRSDYSEVKKIRDQAHTHLKEAVDEICACGQYAFWKDEDRFKGYRSNYLRRIRLKRSAEQAKSEPEEVATNQE